MSSPLAGLEPVAARELTDRIRITLDTAWDLIIRAYQERAWVSLGYESWADYCDTEFGECRVKLSREQRQEIVGTLHEAGLSTRAIASATGHDKNTITKDLRQVSESRTPAPVAGRDGKQYRNSPQSTPYPTPHTPMSAASGGMTTDTSPVRADSPAPARAVNPQAAANYKLTETELKVQGLLDVLAYLLTQLPGDVEFRQTVSSALRRIEKYANQLREGLWRGD